MIVEFADTFFKSLKRLKWHNSFIYKSYNLFVDDIPHFFKNIWRFRKVLWNHCWFDYRYTIEALYTSISIMEKNTTKYGHEIEISRNKKTAKMRRSLEIMKNILDDSYIEIAEEQLGKLPDKPWEFKEIEDRPGFSELVDNYTPEEKELQSQIFDEARKIEEEEWNELFEIFKGKTYDEYKSWLFLNKDKYTQEQIDNSETYNDFVDGKGIKSWWD
jgi:hypothetical protein